MLWVDKIFATRQRAIQALKDRPEAAPALRDLLRSRDAELVRRAEEVLEYYSQAPVRKLYATIKKGQFDSVLDSSQNGQRANSARRHGRRYVNFLEPW